MSGKIYLVRHGETYYNKIGIMHGQLDVPLNNTGKLQAQNVARELMSTKIDVCFCSTLQRAAYTAKEIMKYHKDAEIIYDKRLMEIYKGKLEGVHRDSEEMLRAEPLEVLQKYDIESKAHYFKRVKAFYDEFLPKYKDKNILVVSHSGTVKMSMFYFNPPEDETIVETWYKLHIKNCSIYTVDNILPDKLPLLVEYDVDKELYPLI